MNKDEKRSIQKSMNEEQLKTVKNMSKADWSKLKDQQEFRGVKKGSALHKVSLANDTTRIANRAKMANLKSYLWTVGNAHTVIQKKNLQISTGIITDTVNGDKMTIEELQLEIKNAEINIYKSITSIINELFALAGTVGVTDILGNVVYTEHDYEKTINEIEGELHLLGYKLFD